MAIPSKLPECKREEKTKCEMKEVQISSLGKSTPFLRWHLPNFALLSVPYDLIVLYTDTSRFLSPLQNLSPYTTQAARGKAWPCGKQMGWNYTCFPCPGKPQNQKGCYKTERHKPLVPFTRRCSQNKRVSSGVFHIPNVASDKLLLTPLSAGAD